MDDIAQAPNIGPVLARELRAAGVPTLAELQRLGSKEAWERISVVNPDRRCVNSLLALEGAIRGVRWMKIAPSERAELAAYAMTRRAPVRSGH